jgi:hypothetical protein
LMQHCIAAQRLGVELFNRWPKFEVVARVCSLYARLFAVPACHICFPVKASGPPETWWPF